MSRNKGSLSYRGLLTHITQRCEIHHSVFLPINMCVCRGYVNVSLFNDSQTQQMLSPDYRMSYISSIGQYVSVIPDHHQVHKS